MMPELSIPIILALVWLIAANVIGMFPSPKQKHWPAAYVLMTIGAPLTVWLIREDGWAAAAIFLVAAASILRWPVRFFLRWLRRVVWRRPVGE